MKVKNKKNKKKSHKKPESKPSKQRLVSEGNVIDRILETIVEYQRDSTTSGKAKSMKSLKASTKGVKTTSGPKFSPPVLFNRSLASRRV